MVNQSVVKPTLSFYFPELSNKQLLSVFQNVLADVEHSETLLKQHWESALFEEIGMLGKTIPWNLLRAMQFNISEDVKTVVCCDPVMMQMTHRGAYLWGQQSLEFSKEDVIRIIAQINQQLMSEDECFYLLDNNQWLYTNRKAIELIQPSFEEYIGKDMFGFYYNGSDGTYWDKLATEIQMLIKQMMDYQGLKAAPPEMLVNVHFWGNTNDYFFDALSRENQLSDQDSGSVSDLYSDTKQVKFYSSNHLIETFCKIKNISYTAINKIKISERLEHKKNIVIISNSELTKNGQLIEQSIKNLKKFDAIQLVTQDKSILLKLPDKWLEKIFSFLKSKSQ